VKYFSFKQLSYTGPMAQDEFFEDRDLDASASADEDFAQLLNEHSHLAPLSEGELLKGLVVAVTAKDVIVDFGYKLEGSIPLEQFRLPNGTITVQRGDTIDVMPDRSAPPPEGYVLLSYRTGSLVSFRACD
jgi:small subunit ribosomal protein S1